jgi:formiminotetrahydrofolate cyclodeaminase
MDAQVKHIIIKTNEIYINLSKVEKEKFVKDTQEKLTQHSQAIENIGMGYQLDKVEAAKIYLRYLRRYQP